MKKGRIFLAAVLLLFLAAGCSTVKQPTPEPTPAPTGQSVSDLNAILDTLDLASASLTYHSETEDTYPAAAAICAENYWEELKGFTWEVYSPRSESDENDAAFYQLTAPDATITTFLGSYDGSHPIRLMTGDGEGWFVLQQAEADTDAPTGETIYTIFSSWYNEAKAASLCGGNGEPLTAEEMAYFRQYTESVWTEYDAGSGGYNSGSTEISCFFTSFYDDVRKLDFEAFMRYFPGERGSSAQATEAEFEALKQVEAWPFTDVESLDNMPVPVHKYPRSEVDAVLMKYAGVTTAELDTTGVAYLAEYDAFYTYTSDFGPGSFIPCYGEKSGDTVTLWEAPAEESTSAALLVLQKNGETWQILSHRSDTIS